MRSLLLSLAKIGVIGFGGGAILIPVMERELVDRGGLLKREVFTSHAVIANVTPGAFPVKLAALAASKVGGAWLALIAALVVSIPGAVAAIALLWLLSVLGGGAVSVVEYASVGVSAFIISVVFGYLLKVLRGARSHLVATLTVMIVTFLLTGADTAVQVIGASLGQRWTLGVPQLGALHVVVATIVIVGIWCLISRTSPTHHPASSGSAASSGSLKSGMLLAAVVVVVMLAAFPLGVGRLFTLIALSALTTFGGGAAYIAVADGYFVSPGLVNDATFYNQLVPLANALPGPIMVKLASLVGYTSGSSPLMQWGLALLAFLLVVAMSASVASFFLAGYDKFAESLFVKRLGTWILPVICGLLITTSFGMLRAAIDVGRQVSLPAGGVVGTVVVMAAVLWWLGRRTTISDIALILGAAGLTVAAFLLA